MTHLLRPRQAWQKLNRCRQFTRISRIQAALAGFLVGLGAVPLAWQLPDWLLAAGLGAAPLVLSRRWPGLFAALLLGAVLGTLRGGSYFADLASTYQAHYGQQVTIIGRAEDTSVYNRFGQREFHMSDPYLAEAGRRLPGRVKVSGFGNQNVQHGDAVSVHGQLRPGFGSAQGQISFAEIEIIQRYQSPLTKLRDYFFSGVYGTIGEPQASLGLGFLVGGRTLLPEDTREQLAATGLTHIVAVSGYNLTILVRLTRRLLAKRSKYLATAGSFGLIAAFLGVTGLSPSIARASVVTGLALLAWYYGRRINPLMLLLLSGAITAGITPRYIWSDLGWWLSFLAFAGVLILAPLVSRRLYGDKQPGNLARIVIETSCAQLLTMPLIGWVFGEFSAIAIFANAIILPAIPLAMALTVVAGSAGALLPALAGWFAWPARWLLETMTSLITLLAGIPRALLAVELSAVDMLALYATIAFAAVLILHSLRRRGQRLILNGVEVVE